MARVSFGLEMHCVFPGRHEIAQVASKADTDYSTGAGSVGITGTYHSKTDSFAVEGVYKLDDSSLHVSYGVTEEKLLGVGMETGFDIFGRKNVVDLAYSPPQDAAAMKLTVRQGKSKIAGFFSFENFSASHVKNHKASYELDTKLNEFESLRMTFNQKTRAAKIKVSRKLDAKNRLDAEYSYIDAARKFVTLTLKHAYSKSHTFSAGANYGSRKYRLEWDCKTANGPWTVTSSFGFSTAPHKGDWSVKRRFEF
jgi:hypothetical protein